MPLPAARKPLSSYHPALHMARVLQRQAFRKLRWHLGPEQFAVTRSDTPLPHKIYRHQSKLRRLHSDDPRASLWQDNKVHKHTLHTPLQVTQRASHSFDPFPDQGRVIPYGTGAALFYNYIDLWLFNPTPMTFQLRIWLTDTLINGEMRAEAQLPYR